MQLVEPLLVLEKLRQVDILKEMDYHLEIHCTKTIADFTYVISYLLLN